MNKFALQTGPVTLYAQLASIMRDRILSGLWKPGEEIPTLDQLVEEFSVARVTVRQAVQMLADEGLLSSQRGRRTFVIWEPPHGDDANPLFSYTGSIDTESGNYSINVLSKQEFEELPPHLASMGTPSSGYMRIRKVDLDNGVPYVTSDNYVALSIYKRIPANAEGNVKLSRLVRDHARPPLAAGKERITVTAMNYEEATVLQVPIGSPGARITRVFLTQDGKIGYAGQLLYRADRFAVDRDITELLIGGDVPSGKAAAASRAPVVRRLPLRKPAGAAASKSSTRQRV
jgi:GntR family transcriptional regulator